jgi:hypothetical protein
VIKELPNQVKVTTPQLEPYQRLAILAERITYKPGWRIEVMPPEESDRFFNRPINLLLLWPAQDINTKQPTRLATSAAVSPAILAMMTDEEVVKRVFCDMLIKRTELHEMDEWFKLDGVCVFEPHPELKTKLIHTRCPTCHLLGDCVC